MEGKGKDGKGREWKGREGEGREGNGKEGKERQGMGREGNGREWKGREGERREGKGIEGKEPLPSIIHPGAAEEVGLGEHWPTQRNLVVLYTVTLLFFFGCPFRKLEKKKVDVPQPTQQFPASTTTVIIIIIHECDCELTCNRDHRDMGMGGFA